MCIRDSLGDGQANAQQANMQSSSKTGGPSLTSSGTYPSYKDDCQQAIIAAQKATKAGTVVYAVAYGSESTGCGVSGGSSTATDTTLVATGTNAPFTLSTLTPCMTMENIASNMSKFFSDYMQSGSGSTCKNTKDTENNNSLNAISVSYTHLDVYKRQCAECLSYTDCWRMRRVRRYISQQLVCLPS